MAGRRRGIPAPMRRAMRGLATALIALATTHCGPPPSPHVATSAPTTSRLQLANGLVVYLQPDLAARHAHVLVRYHVGSKDDPQANAGLAHLAEHLMFEPVTRTASRSFNEALDAQGALFANARTSWDSTDFYEATPPETLERVLWLEAARMATPLELVDESALTRERNVVVNELHERRDDMPFGAVHEALASALFEHHHPYARTIAGSKRELDGIGLDALRRHASMYYRPNDATLVVTGRFDAARIRAAVIRTFESIPPGEEPPRATVQTRPRAESVVLQMRAAVDSKVVVLGWTAPPASDPSLALCELGLEGLRRRLGAAFSPKVLVGVEAGIVRGRLASMATVAAHVTSEVSTKDVVALIDRVADQMRSFGHAFTPWFELPNVKTRHNVRALARTETPGGRAWRILEDVDSFGAPDGLPTELGTIDDAHPGEVVSTLFGRVLDRSRVIVTVEPDPKAPPMGTLTRSTRESR